MDSKLTTSDYLFLAICICIIVFSFWYSAANFYRAFPEASIDFTITKEEANEKSAQLLQKMGHSTKDFKNVTIFDYDTMSKVFLERELGLEAANALFNNEVPIWSWKTRWFKPLQKEEFSIALTPQGKLTGYSHGIEEDSPGADLDSLNALNIAESFITELTETDLQRLNPPETKMEKRTNRTDHTFTFNLKDSTYAGATYQYIITVQGDVVGHYEERLDITENWIRDYRALRSLNNTTGTVNFLFIALTFFGMLVIFIRRIMFRDIQWGIASVFGAIAFFLNLSNQLNGIPLELYNYVTTESYSAFFVKNIIEAVLFSLSVGAIIFLITASAETLYRKDFPQMISFQSMFSWKAIRSKKFLKDTMLGYALTGGFLVYQIVFYLVADKFGAWSPAEIPYSNILNTFFPWIAVIFIGFFPAVSEEFFNRVFAIAFFRRIFRSPVIAVIFAAFLWGFGHATYPNQPFFIRGLEVGIAGIVCGFILLRFGVLPLLIWHYTIDALYTAIVLFRSSNTYFIIMAGFTTGIVLIPLFISLVSYILSGRFHLTKGLRNDEVKKYIGPPRDRQAVVRKLNQPWKRLPLGRVFLTLGIFLICTLSLAFLPSHSTLKQQDFTLSTANIQNRADYILNRFGGSIAKYRSVVYVSPNFVEKEDEGNRDREDLDRFEDKVDFFAMTYILQHGGVQRVQDVFSEIPSLLWTVRYFQPGQKEEWKIYLNTLDGKPSRFSHLRPKEEAGANLSAEQAEQKAIDFFFNMGIVLDDYVLKDKELKKRPNRTDHIFIWEHKDTIVANAKERLFLLIRGNQIGEFKKYVKIPEQWIRYRMEKDVSFYIRFALQNIFILFISTATMWLLFSSLRRRILQWGVILKWALLPTAFVFINLLNQLPRAFAGYQTAIALETYYINIISGLMIQLVFQYIVFCFFLAVIDSRIPLSDRTLSLISRKTKVRDALWGFLIAGSFFLLVEKVQQFLTATYPQYARISELNASASLGLNLPIPLLNTFESLVFNALFALAFLVAIDFIYRTFIQSIWKTGLLLICCAVIFVPLECKSAGEFLFSFAEQFLLFGGVFYLVFFIFKNNYIAYILLVSLIPLFEKSVHYMSLTNVFFKANGIVLASIGVIILLSSIKKAIVAESYEDE